jgi:hypothetical protein
MLPVGSFVNNAASGVGFMAATVAVCGFLGQAAPALMRKDDQTVRARMVLGGLVGLVVAAGLILITYIL